MSHGREVAGNVAWLVTGGVLGKAARFAATVVVANAVGASGFGVLSTVLGVAFAAAALSDLGLSQLATRELSRQPDRAAGTASTVLVLKLVVMAAVTALGAVVALRLPAGVRPVAFASLALLATHESLFEWLFEGGRAVPALGAYRLVVNGGFLVCALLLVRTPGDLSRVPLLDAASSATAVAVSLALWPRVLRLLRARPRPSEWAGLVGRAAPMGVANVLVLSIPSIGVFVLAGLRGPAEAGTYRAAAALVFGAGSAAFLFARAVYPVMSRVAGEGHEGVWRTLAPVVKLAIAVAIPAALSLSLLARAVVALLYEPEYAASADALAILAWAIPFGFTATLAHYALMAVGHERSRLASLLIHATVELGLCAALALAFSHVGAAAAHVAAQAAGMILALWRVRATCRASAAGAHVGHDDDREQR